ncbi:MAG: Metal dependent phosphohydrolase [Segetibacter sp.]|nr:Metal dependent phosphohydrolase [Segetibacter sp.]
MNTTPVTPRNNLYCFVTLKHHQQKRKYTNEPYFNHVLAVAEMADGMCKFGYEIGLCHDLLEDTDCTAFELTNALIRFGYTASNSIFIKNAVLDLTDVYIPEKYPHINRAERKRLEALRLHEISPEAQTVKYCDLIHNTSSIVKHDKGFAKLFLAEATTILKGMNKGNKPVYEKAKRVVKKGIDSLEKLIKE